MLQIRPVLALVSVALVPLLLGLLGLLDPTATVSKGGSALVVALSLFAIVAGLAYEARRDLSRTARYAAWLCVPPLVLAVVVVAVSESTEARLKAAGVAAPFVLLALASAALVIRDQLAEDGVENPLRDRFPTSSIWESEGVQWAANGHSAVVSPEGTWVRVFLQSCVAAPRRVHITFEDRAGFLSRSGSLTWPALEPFELGPGDVGVLHVPIAPTGARRGDVDLYVAVAAYGPPGARVRRWRARAGSKPLSPWLTLLAIFGGVVAWGGGVRLRLSIAIARGVSSAAVLGPPRWEPLWGGSPIR